LAGAGVSRRAPMDKSSSQTITSRSGSRYLSGRTSTALTSPKMAVFAPMPSASVTTVTSVNPGRFRSTRAAYLMSLRSEVMANLKSRES
jgi:hypothetical protein